MAQPMHHVTVVILAGGRSSRMGIDKRFLTMPDGRTLLTIALEKARKISPRVILSVAHGDAVCKVKGARSVQDGTFGLGPLSGLSSSLDRITTDKACVIPCDAPFIPIELLKHLLRVSERFDVVVPVPGRVQPLVGIYRRKTLPLFREALRYRDLSFHKLLQVAALRIRYVRRGELEGFGDPRIMFLNINTKKDLSRGRRLAKKVDWDY